MRENTRFMDIRFARTTWFFMGDKKRPGDFMTTTTTPSQITEGDWL